VSLIRPTERAETEIPETDLDGLAYLGGSSLGDLLDAEFEATEASLAAADVPNLRVEIDRVDERGLGELLYAMEAACVLYGELASVSTFTQPAVEWGRRRLGDCSAAAISRRPTPWPTSANCGSTAPEPGESISPIPSPWTSGAPNTPCAQPPAMTDDLPVPVDRLTHAASAVFALIFALVVASLISQLATSAAVGVGVVAPDTNAFTIVRTVANFVGSSQPWSATS